MAEARNEFSRENSNISLLDILEIKDLHLLIFSYLSIREWFLLARVSVKLKALANRQAVYHIEKLTITSILQKKHQLIAFLGSFSDDVKNFLLTLTAPELNQVISFLKIPQSERLTYLRTLEPKLSEHYLRFSFCPSDFAMIGAALSLIDLTDNRIPKRLNYYSLMMLKHKYLSSSEVAQINNLEIFSKFGLKAIQRNLIPKEILTRENLAALPALMSDEGLTLLDSKLLDVNDLKLFNKDYYGRYIPKLEYLATKNGIEALKQGLLTVKDALEVHCLKTITSDKGYEALKIGLITIQQAKSFPIFDYFSDTYFNLAHDHDELTYVDFTLIDYFFSSNKNALELLKSKRITVDDLIKLSRAGVYSEINVILNPEVQKIIDADVITIDDICRMNQSRSSRKIKVEIKNSEADKPIRPISNPLERVKEFGFLFHFVWKHKTLLETNTQSDLPSITLTEDEFIGQDESAVLGNNWVNFKPQMNMSYFPDRLSCLSISERYKQSYFMLIEIPSVLEQCCSQSILPYFEHWLASGTIQKTDLHDIRSDTLHKLLSSIWGIKLIDNKLLSLKQFKQINSTTVIELLATEQIYFAMVEKLFSMQDILDLLKKYKENILPVLLSEKGIAALRLGLITIKDAYKPNFQSQVENVQITSRRVLRRT